MRSKRSARRFDHCQRALAASRQVDARRTPVNRLTPTSITREELFVGSQGYQRDAFCCQVRPVTEHCTFDMGHSIAGQQLTSDAELLEASRRGEHAAFGALVGRYQHVLAGYIRRP